MEKDLKNMTPGELEKLIEELGQKKYLAGYIFSFIHAKNADRLDSITTLSKDLRQKLKDEGYYISQIKIAKKLTDQDGTVKYLFELPDGLAVESVLLKDDERLTLCASTQVGCAMCCDFCATGHIKFKRNLTAAEIADQVNVIEKDRNPHPSPEIAERRKNRIANIVFMGMGEPLMNYENVLRAVRILNAKGGKNIGIRHLTISTCGIADKIKMLANETIKPRLAISLNAADNELRNKIMPVNKKYSLSALLNAVRIYQDKTGDRVTFEYVLIKDVNDRDADARQLSALAKKYKCNINLIELNFYPGCEFQPSTREQIHHFAQILKQSGIETVIRFKRGTHIKAACGQLGSEMLNKNSD